MSRELLYQGDYTVILHNGDLHTTITAPLIDPDYAVRYTHDITQLPSEQDKEQTWYVACVPFETPDKRICHEEALAIAKILQARILIPMYVSAYHSIRQELLDFASAVMLDNYAVPKVLTPGQAVVFG